MFDSVGRDLDREAGRRRALSALITLTLLGTLGGAAGLYGAFIVGHAVVAVLDTEPMLEATLEGEVLPDSAPPPPPPAAAGVRREKAETPEPTPTDAVAALDDQVDETVKGQVPPSGDVEGVDGGSANGEGDEIGGGNGDGPGTASGSITILRTSELRWKRAPTPTYPDAARELNLPETTCKAVITFDEQGTPYEVTFQACPTVFQEAARTAILNSRMYPEKRAGVAIRGRFTLKLVFKLS